MQAALAMPHLPAGDPLRRVLDAAFAARDPGVSSAPPADEPPFWPAEFFGLPMAPIFAKASRAEQDAIVADCAHGLLAEAFFIEKAGIAYAARRIATAESTEERQLYALFAADEATHLRWIAEQMPAPPAAASDPFLDLLAEVIETAPPAALVFVVQVVLEGWGLVHYARLKDACAHAALRAALQRILKDEARHHGSGLILFERTPLGPAERRPLFDALARFLELVRAGPQGTVAAIARTKGGLTRSERAAVFTALNAEAHSAERLSVLQRLMQRAGPSGRALVDDLETRGLFRPLSPEDCA